MPSNSLLRWNRERSSALDEIEAAHVRVGGNKRGRRYATQQINRAYAVLLSSEFQGFVRDLYSECVDNLVSSVMPPFQHLMRTQCQFGKPFGRGNAQAGEIGSEFGRLGLPFWTVVYAAHAENTSRKERLDELMKWRNAIAHSDFVPLGLGIDPSLQLKLVRGWRRAIDGLCEDFDRVLRDYLTGIIGTIPWQ